MQSSALLKDTVLKTMNKIEELLKQYKSIQDRHFNLDMTRGKPCKEQLDLSMPMLDILNSSVSLNDSEGYDCRNYGKLDGLKQCKELLADLIEVNSDDIIIFGNSSLEIMYDLLSNACLYGIDGHTPFSKLAEVKWLCPVPGYDRHFAMCEHLGIKMINVPMDKNGPNMDIVEELIKDPTVKGIWCVPKYSNPTGISYSQEVVSRFARLKPAAKDFRIYWDNAYSVHHLYDDKQDFIPEILNECRKYNNEDIVYKFTSTSKISFPGSGIAAVAASKKNIEEILNHLKYKTIGYDKVNQLRHVRFFKNIEGIKEHMGKHADILRPKFEYIDSRLNEISDIVEWNKPYGGYFLSIFVKGYAKEVVERCKNMGLKLTEAGCAYPYHIDNDNAHIRLAPSYLSLDELEVAMSILILAIRIEYLIHQK